MQNRSIVVLGSVNQDHMVKTEHLPKKGETVIGDGYLTSRGGKGANQALAATRLAGQVSFIACIGEDSFGTQLVESYKTEGMNTQAIQQLADQQSGVALICVDAAGSNFIAVAANANKKLSAQQVAVHQDLIQQAEFLLMQLETPLDGIMQAATIAQQAHCKIVLNPAPARALPSELLKQLYLITPNEGEAAMLTGITIHDQYSAHQAAQALQAQGVKNVIITLGEQGAFYLDEQGQSGLFPAYSVAAKDTTAAGDTFNGALVVALTEGKNLLQAIEFACKASALCVTRLGAQPAIPTRQEVDHYRFNTAV